MEFDLGKRLEQFRAAQQAKNAEKRKERAKQKENRRLAEQAQKEVSMAKEILYGSGELHAMNQVIQETPIFPDAEFLANAVTVSAVAEYVSTLVPSVQEEARGKVEKLWNMFEEGGRYILAIDENGDFTTSYEKGRWDDVQDGEFREQTRRKGLFIETEFLVGPKAIGHFLFDTNRQYLLAGKTVPEDFLLVLAEILEDDELPTAMIEDVGIVNRERLIEKQRRRFS